MFLNQRLRPEAAKSFVRGVVSRPGLFALLAACSMLSTNVLATGALDREVMFDIPAESLSQALMQFARAANIQLMLNGVAAEGHTTAELKGVLRVRDALETLLRGSGLSYRSKDNTVTVAAPMASSDSGQKLVRVADAASLSSREESAVPAEGSGTVAQSETSIDEKAEQAPLQQVVITGSHIRGAEPVGTKVLVITRDDIDKSGYGRIEDVINTLPQNFAGISETSTQVGVANLNNGTEIQLRGLGAGTTLTLIDGKRQPAGGSLGAFTDISSIPAAAVERIEILPDGASAIYGSDAIGGVVNIILRQDFEGAETRLRGSTADGDADQAQLAQLFGTHWASGHVMVAYQYSKSDPLNYGSRPYTATSGDLVPFGGSDFRYTYGNPGNIANAAGKPVFAIPGGQNGSNLTAAQLLPGVVNYQDISYASILPEQEMHSVFASASQSLGEQIDLHADARYSTRAVTSFVAAPGRTVSVPSSNPFYVNPFGGTGPVSVQYNFAGDLGPVTSTGHTDTLVANLGADVKLIGDWHLAAAFTYGRELTNWLRLNLVNNAALKTALADPNSATALDVFGSGSYTNPATLDQIREQQFERGVSRVVDGGLVVDGSLFHFLGGDARLALGVDLQQESLDVDSDFDLNGVAHSSRRDSAVFSEVTLPLIGEAQAVPGVQKLEFTAAGREDHYSDVGSTLNPKIGLNWVVFSQLKVRGTWGTSFRAPPFYLENAAIHPSLYTSLVEPDPKSPSHTTDALILTGTNPDLKPETATDWTAGLDLMPVSAMSVSLSYFNIKYRDKIESGPNASQVLPLESEWAALITRNPTPAQVSAVCSQPSFVGDCTGPFGAILDLRYRNFAAVTVRGLDLESQYKLSTGIGAFKFHVEGTYMFDYDAVVTPSAPVVNEVDTVGKPLSVRLRGGVSWGFHGWNVNAIVNHDGSYHDPSFTPARRVSPWTTVDAGVGYLFPDESGWLSGLQLMVNATNVFNTEPPFVNEALEGYDPANASLVGRTVSVQIVKSW